MAPFFSRPVSKPAIVTIISLLVNRALHINSEYEILISCRNILPRRNIRAILQEYSCIRYAALAKRRVVLQVSFNSSYSQNKFSSFLRARAR